MEEVKYLRDSHENTSTRSKSADKVARNGESTNASTTKGSSGRNDTLELTVHALIAVAGHDESLILELLGHVTGAGSRHLDPSLGEGGAGSQHVDDKEGSVDGVEKSILEAEGRGPEMIVSAAISRVSMTPGGSHM